MRISPNTAKRLMTEKAARGEPCAMPICYCPNGRTYFEIRSVWQATADRIIPEREDGLYTSENIRLAHFMCNSLEGSYFGPERQPHEAKIKGGQIGGKIGIAVMWKGWGQTKEAHDVWVAAGMKGGSRNKGRKHSPDCAHCVVVRRKKRV